MTPENEQIPASGGQVAQPTPAPAIRKPMPKWPFYFTVILGILIGLLLSAVMLKSATSKHNGTAVGPYKVEFSASDECLVNTPARLTLLVTSETKPAQIKLAYYGLTRAEARPVMVFRVPPMKKDFQKLDMLPAGNTGFYTAVIPPMEMSAQYYYYFMMTDATGQSYDFFPSKDKEGNAKPANITYRQPSTLWVTILHIAFMGMVIFFLLHIIYYALAHLASSEFPIGKAYLSAIWANVFFFLTAFPIGMYVEWKAYDRAWGGMPVAWSWIKTDNKSLYIFVYWVVILLLIRGFDRGGNKISSKAFAWLSLIGVIGTILVFVTGGHSV